jgi:hypothetical protein
MIGMTAFGIFLTPVLYVLLRQLSGNRPPKQHRGASERESFHAQQTKLANTSSAGA